MNEQETLETLVKQGINECFKNEIIYGCFCLNKEIPKDIKAMHYQPERLNPETIDSAWIKWDILVPPRDVKGIFIKFDNDQIWTDVHFYGSDEYREKTVGDAKPIAWTFIKRRDPNEKSIQC